MRLVRKLRQETGERHEAVKRVAEQLGHMVESVRSWGHEGNVDEGVLPAGFYTRFNRPITSRVKRTSSCTRRNLGPAVDGARWCRRLG